MAYAELASIKFCLKFDVVLSRYVNKHCFFVARLKLVSVTVAITGLAVNEVERHQERQLFLFMVGLILGPFLVAEYIPINNFSDGVRPAIVVLASVGTGIFFALFYKLITVILIIGLVYLSIR